MSGVVIAWLRRDLRIADNAVLADASRHDRPVLPVYIHAPGEAGEWAPGAASNWWLHHVLGSLRDELASIGLPLVIRSGGSETELTSIIQSLRGAGLSVDAVVSGRLTDPALAERDERVRESMEGLGVSWRQHNTALLTEPGTVCTKAAQPYRVFTPFWKALRALPVESPVPIDKAALRAPSHVPGGVNPGDLDLLPTVNWDDGLAAAWSPDPAGARETLDRFVEQHIGDYAAGRDRPGVEGTSRLSPYLHWGQIGPRQVWAAVHATGAQERDGGFTFLSELAWREFAHHLLHHFPDTPTEPLHEKYRKFPWEPDGAALQAWQRGRTGYPFVDAGMGSR